MTAIERARTRSRFASIAVLVALVGAACGPGPSPTPIAEATTGVPPASTQPVASPAASVADSPPPVPSSIPAPDETAPSIEVLAAPTSADKILADVEAGTLDEVTALLYRIYAIFGDPRLPAEYASSNWSEDAGAIALALDQLDTLPTEIAAEIRPFLVRPTDPESVFYGSGATASAGGRVTLASTRTAASVVCNTGWGYLDGAAPFRVWGSCGTDIENEIITVATLMERLWAEETAFMGRDPIKDLGGPDRGGSDRIDIYLVSTCVTRGGRCTAPGRFGITPPSVDFEGVAASRATSAFMVINRALVARGEVELTLAHEFFHVLQLAYNKQGSLEGAGYHWFYEASATWAQWYFVPASGAQETGTHERYLGFQVSPYSVQSTKSTNEYFSFTWPLFMEQESGARSIAKAWQSIRGRVGQRAFSEAINAQLSFDSQFREFAVRNYNQELAGNPIKKLFPGGAVDPDRDPPLDPRSSDSRTLAANPPGTPPLKIFEVLPPLYAAYRPFKVNDDVGQITVDFSGLKPGVILDVDVLLKIKGQNWKRQELPDGKTRFCTAVDDEDVEEFIIILSDHDWGPGAQVIGNWTVESLLEPCLGWKVKLTWTDRYAGIDDTVVFEGVIDTIDQAAVEGSLFMTGIGTATGSRPGWKACNPGIQDVPFGVGVPAFLGATIVGETMTVAAFAEGSLSGVTTDYFEVPVEGGKASFENQNPIGSLCPRTSFGTIEVTKLDAP